MELRIAPAALAAREGDASEAARSRRELDGIECRVCDTGGGILQEDRERVFDPFFTTKAASDGPGLGLSVSRDLATQCGGVLDLAETSNGATFRFRFPLTEKE